MKIGFYHEAAGTKHAGGVAVYIQQMAAHLSETNDVYLYTQQGEVTELLSESDVTIVDTPRLEARIPDTLYGLSPLGRQDTTKASMTAWAYLNDLLTHIEETVDVVLTFSWIDDLLLSNLVDVPTIHGYHAVDSVGLASRVHQLTSSADSVLANSEDTARKVKDHFDRTVDAVVYPGVDTSLFTPDADPALTSDRPIILYVGRLFEAKGIFELLDAVASLDVDVELHVVGHGRMDAVKTRIRSLEIDDAVTLHGEVPHSDLPGYYTSADVFCLPSHTESFGMVNLEAMACGVPVVTSDLEAIRRYLTHWEHGLLVEPDDPIQLAAALETMLSSAETRAAFGERGRERATEFTWENQSRRLKDHCVDVVGVNREAENRSAPDSAVTETLASN